MKRPANCLHPNCTTLTRANGACCGFVERDEIVGFDAEPEPMDRGVMIVMVLIALAVGAIILAIL